MSKKKDIRNIVIPKSQYIDQFTRFIASENIKLLKGHGTHENDPDVPAMLNRFLKNYVEILLTGVFMQPGDTMLTQEEQYEATSERMMNLKHDVQEEIAEAFTTAVSGFTSQQVDYFCDIAPMPEPINELAC